MSEEFRAIRPDELSECLDLWGRVFDRAGRDYFLPYFYGDPWYRPDYTRVCVVDGRIVSAVQVCERHIRFGASELVMGGIANVATDIEHQGKGYSSRLLSDAVNVMSQAGMNFSLLFTGIQPFYERLGWRSAPTGSMSSRLDSAIPEIGESEYSVRVDELGSDVTGIRAVYDEFNKTRALSTVRTPEYWNGYVCPRIGPSEVVLEAESMGRTVGYLRFSPDGAVSRFMEIGYMPEDEACVHDLVHRAARMAVETGSRSICSYLPDEPVISQCIREVAGDAEFSDTGGAMVRFVDMESLGERIMPELNRRAVASDPPPGLVSLDTEMGSLCLAVGGGRVRIGTRDLEKISLCQADFFRLIFGIKTAEDLGLIMSRDARRIISALFPVQPSVYWQADHF